MNWRKWLPSITLIFVLVILAWMIPSRGAEAGPPAQTEPGAEGTFGIYRGLSEVVKFDISPALRDIPAVEINKKEITEILERPTGLEGPLGPQDTDSIVQSVKGPDLIPTPIVSFDGPTNIASVSPPDPVGDVGPNHYVAMSNLYFAVYNKTGTVLYGPAANNTLWAGFGGDCETDNSGDPIVVYDQLADRWILTQFTASGPTYFNCVAVSTTPDPTGTYYRYAFSSGSNFPDYPKYGVWPDALYISTREFAGASFAGVGAYAVDRAQLIAGNPTPQVISFLVPPGAMPYNVGDGLLPTDLDGTTLPPGGSPNYFVGSMDDGGPYGAPQDALTIWEFAVDFVTPANSSFTLANTVPVAPFDSMFPCSPGSRDCIPQPGTTNKIDVLSYRQRPMWRLAYRNFGSHESLVTNQAVEAAANIAGIRWYEIRDPNGTPTIYQQGTYAPGTTDGIHRWMGSIAMDQTGNMALGYSASDATTTYPSSWYTGRLVGDPLGTMPQGEGSIINGTGSQTGSQRWGDYTSMNVDPVDDCTFWYVNEYVPVTSSVGWVLRIGAFKFDSCGTSDFTLSVDPPSQDMCIPDDALYDITVGQVQSFSNDVTLSTSGTPAGTSSAFSTNPVTPPGMSTLTLGTSAASAGSYSFDVVGVAPTSTHTATVGLNLFDAVPGATTLVAPADGAVNVGSTPTFEWTAASGAASYALDVATDAAFTSLVYTATVPAPATTHTPALALAPLTTYYWRVTPDNVCGPASPAPTFFFVTGAVVCSAPNLAIPDSGATSDTISIPSGGPLTDLNVYLDVSHTWVGDLAFSLQHVDTGTTAGILDRPGVPASTFGCSGNNIGATLDDEGTDGDAETTCLAGDPTLSGSLVPGDPPSTSLLAAFDGENLSGDWLLSISDNAGGDTGTLNQWCLAAEIDFPNINLAKTVGTDPGICAATSSLAVAPGTDVFYCYEVTNTGTITLGLHDLADDQLGTILSGFPFNLTPGASVWLTQTATITQPTTNTATWTASNAGPTDVVSATASATVDLFANLQVAHLAPFAMDPGTAVTVTLNGTPVLTDFAYTDSTVYLHVTQGSYLVEIIPGGSPTPAITGTVVLMPGDGLHRPRHRRWGQPAPELAGPGR